METTKQNDVMTMLKALAEHKNLHVTKKSVMTGAGIALVSGGLGMAFGPVGLAAGAAVGVVAMSWVNEVPLIQVLKDLSAEMKEMLCTGVNVLLKGWDTLDALLNMVMSSLNLQNKITDFLQRFFMPQNMVVAPR